MREIKFRGWDEENKKWRYGHFFESLEGIRRVYNIVENRDTRYSCSNSSIFQFTGLRDKNNTEVYEGDILHLKNHWPCKVEFYKGRFRLFPLDKTLAANFSSENWFLSDYIDIDWVVVGNIHQNKMEEFI